MTRCLGSQFMSKWARMKTRISSFNELVEARLPGLIGKIKRAIEQSEKKFAGQTASGESYLWEHTAHVAALSYKLAVAEKRPPLLPIVTALFHDAGKFGGGRYHEDDRAEEEYAARIAKRLLAQAGMPTSRIERVANALRALYNAGSKPNAISAIVHDADFLAKFGALGAAQFFVKSTLRGKTLREAVLRSLSKELTYAASLPRNMRTRAGRRLARKKSRESLRFFGSLLGELKEAGVADLSLRTVAIASGVRPRNSVDVRIAVPKSCPTCGGSWRTAYSTEPGLKCEKLEVRMTCGRCGEASDFSFCLPEIQARAAHL